MKRHNKSNIQSLSFLQNEDLTLTNWLNLIKSTWNSGEDPIIEGSPCLLMPTADGRFTANGKKVAYGYQLVAFERFGREEMSKVAASKSREDLVVSHLCGTRNCCNGNHLVLEPKWVNDERTHCHFTLRNAKSNSGYKGMRKILGIGICPHNPKCCTLQDLNK